MKARTGAYSYCTFPGLQAEVLILGNNIIIRILTRIFDLMILNILWLVCSVGIITIGASTTALYSVMLKIVRNEEGYIVRDFFKAFRENFRQSTVIWMVLLAVGMLLMADTAILHRMQGGAGLIGTMVFYIIVFFYFMEIIFVFPLIAKFENTTGSMIKNAILIPASRLPYAVMVLVMTGACVLLTFLDHRTIIAGIGIWSVIGTALLAYVNCFLIMKIFEPYL